MLLSLVWHALVWKVVPRKACTIYRLLHGTSVCLAWEFCVDARLVMLGKGL